MKWLKKYKLFESIPSEILNDIEDIVLELNDSGRITAKIYSSIKFGTYIGFFIKETMDMGTFNFDDIEEYVFRIRDYLGDMYLSCSALFQDQYDDMDGSIHRVEINLQDKKIIDSIRSRELKNLIIQIK